MKNIIPVVLIFIFASCISDSEIRRTNNIYDIIKREYSLKFNVDLLSHLPDSLTRDCAGFQRVTSVFNYYTGLMVSYEYQSQRDKIISIINDSTIYATKYSAPQNIIINHMDLGFNEFKDEKCNKWYKDKFPIPYFDQIYFGLGNYKVENEYCTDKDVVFYKYRIPIDLEVYVIESKPGFCFRHETMDKYPKSLKEWEHGFSRGIAVSKKMDRVYYWAMAW